MRTVPTAGRLRIAACVTSRRAAGDASMRCLISGSVRQRARSAEDKAQRSEDLLNAAEELALELGGVRFVTVAPVTDRAGLHRTGVRRYYAPKEELLIKLAERGGQQWQDAMLAATGGQVGLDPSETAQLISETL